MNFNALSSFFKANKMGSKGSLCVGLAISREARRTGLPLNFESILTENRGQVKVLGKANIQRILADYGIERVLAEEGGRTRDSKCATSCQVRRHKYALSRSFRAENLAPRPPKATSARLLRVEEIPFHGLFIPRSAASPLRFRECVRGTSCGPASPPQTRLSRESRLSELP